MKKATKSYALRIDGPLVKPLQELKKRNRRSLNAEINAALEAWISATRERTATPEDASSKSAEELPSDAAKPSDAATKPPGAKRRSKRKAAAEAAVTPETTVETESAETAV